MVPVTVELEKSTHGTAQRKSFQLSPDFKILAGNSFEIRSTEPDEKGGICFTLYIIIGRVVYVAHGRHFSDKENAEILDELNEGMEEFILEERRKAVEARRELADIILM